MAVLRTVYEKINITCFPHIYQHVKTIVNCKIPEKTTIPECRKSLRLNNC